jgi:PPM family protein phosphatase
MLVMGFGLSEKGPRKKNEDAYKLLIEKDRAIAVVADGVGGNAGGEVASKIAVEEVISYATLSEGDPLNILRDSFLRANLSILREASKNPSLNGMATTCTGVLIKDCFLCLAHVGDSRAYIYRRGDLVRLTEDHSLPNSNVLVNALGVKENFYVETHKLKLMDLDKILLCTDGLYKSLKSEEIEKILSKSKGLQTPVQKLVELALRNGCNDNITVVLLEVRCG